MNNKPFDPTKPVQTRDGRAARILATDAKNACYPIIAVIQTSAGEKPQSYTLEGRFCFGVTDDTDLVNVPEGRVLECWINAYPDGTFSSWFNASDAQAYRGHNGTTIHVRHNYIVGEHSL